MSRHIAIIGSGPVGIALATQLISAGHHVTLSNSRGPETLVKQAAQTGATPEEVNIAVSAAEIVVLATPVSSIEPLAQICKPLLRSGAIIIDACNYYPARDGQIKELDGGALDSVWTSQNFSVPVVKAFNNIIAANLVINARPRGRAGRVALPVASNDPKALETVRAMVDDIGFDPYNAGRLAETWRYQPGQPAYCTEPTLNELPALLMRADPNREQINAARDKTRGLIETLPEGYSPQNLLRVSRLSNGLDRWNVRSWFAAVAVGSALVRASVLGGR